MQLPGAVDGRVVRAPFARLARWIDAFGSRGAWLGGVAWSGLMRSPGPASSGGSPALGRPAQAAMRSRPVRLGWVVSVWWGGGQPAVGAAAQPPAPLMHGPMMGPAHQGQIGKVGGAAVQPVDQMMSLAPGQRPGTGGEDTAPVTHGQGAAPGRRAGRPGWPAPPPGAGWGPHPGSGATGPRRPAAAQPAPPLRSKHRRSVEHRRRDHGREGEYREVMNRCCGCGCGDTGCWVGG